MDRVYQRTAYEVEAELITYPAIGSAFVSSGKTYRGPTFRGPFDSTSDSDGADRSTRSFGPDRSGTMRRDERPRLTDASEVLVAESERGPFYPPRDAQECLPSPLQELPGLPAPVRATVMYVSFTRGSYR